MESWKMQKFKLNYFNLQYIQSVSVAKSVISFFFKTTRYCFNVNVKKHQLHYYIISTVSIVT